MTNSRRKQIDLLADTVRKACGLEVPVDVEEAVNRLDGVLKIEFTDEYEAKIERTAKGFAISLAHKYSGPRRRFSVAHELGHLFLHMGYLVDEEKWSSVSDYTDSVYYRFGHTTEEYEAHEFAAAFLMPAEVFRHVARAHKMNAKYNVAPIAKHFEVSEEAAINRGRWLGIFAWDIG